VASSIRTRHLAGTVPELPGPLMVSRRSAIFAATR